MAASQGVLTIEVNASADLSASQYCGVITGSTGLALPTTHTRIDGVLQDKPAAANRAGTIVIVGKTKMVYAATLAVGDAVAVDGAGKAVAVATGYAIVGRCLKAGVTGDIGEILMFNQGVLSL